VDFRASIDRLAKVPIPRDIFRDLDGRLILAGQTLIPLSGDRAFRPADLRAVIDLSGGILKRFDDSPPLTDLQARLRLAGSDVVLEKFSGKAQGSPFDVTGGFQVALPWEEGGAAFRTLDLHLVSRGALLLRQPDLRVRGDIDVRWTGPLDRSLLAGSVTITRAYYFHDIPLTPRRGARLPLRLFSLGAPFDRLRFDIKVTSDRAIWVRNNMIMTRASADLKLGGTGLEPMLTGTITTDEGRVRFATASLNISTSLIEFLPADPLNPRLQIALHAEVRGYSIFVSITCSLEEPEVLLDSSPPLEREKVLVLITTGLTFDEIEDRGVDRVAAVQAAKYAVYRIANYFSSKDPLEKSFLGRFSLETESARSSEYDDLIRIEYSVAEGLLLERDVLFFQTERDTYGDFNFNVGLRFELEP
ncbi:MAG TPA: translocation/assembly module TamB domain-containing protein, partial [Planctomycetota bacterium]|nr:translocation/assembly module TamB domain-containing protein [Planctomycetota bacterium]